MIKGPIGRKIMTKRTNGSIAAALAITVAVTSLNIAPAQAASKSQPQAAQTTTDFSARRHWRGGNRAGLAIVAGMFGTIAALAAADQYNDGYYGDPGYSCGYAPGYRYGGWHHRH